MTRRHRTYALRRRLSPARRQRPPVGGSPPDFVGVGVQRCGTTWWYDLIAAHPQVGSGFAKERHFFDRFCQAEMTAADVDAYRQAFPRADGQIAGEWTPRYGYDFWTPPLLRRAAPGAKLLFLVRDPLARMRSGIAHQSELTPPRDSTELAYICADAAARGHYAAQFRRLLEHFPREQIHVLQYERCQADPLGELRRTYRYLGVEDGFVPEGIEKRRGRSAPPSAVALPAGLVDAYVRELADDIAELVALVPELDVSLWPAASRR